MRIENPMILIRDCNSLIAESGDSHFIDPLGCPGIKLTPDLAQVTLGHFPDAVLIIG
jgi:hypothetical protein